MRDMELNPSHGAGASVALPMAFQLSSPLTWTHICDPRVSGTRSGDTTHRTKRRSSASAKTPTPQATRSPSPRRCVLRYGRDPRVEAAGKGEGTRDSDAGALCDPGRIRVSPRPHPDPPRTPIGKGAVGADPHCWAWTPASSDGGRTSESRCPILFSLAVNS